MDLNQRQGNHCRMLDTVTFAVSRDRFLVFVVGMLMLMPPSSATAQLSQDVRDVFEGMLDNLDPQLQKKFRRAIKNDTDKVEFTPEQFLRFRDNPANPFEGLDRIKVDPNGGNIALKFALPSLRDRPIDTHERQSPMMLARLSGPALTAARSTVKVIDGSRHISMGVVISTDGLIVTKASELKGRDQLRCLLPSRRSVEAKLIKSNEQHDLAILKVEASRLQPIRWSEVEPKLGEFLLSPDFDGSLIAIGSYSVRARSTTEGEAAFLGVQPVTTDDGVRVQDIRPDNASYQAGLRDGDVLISIDQDQVQTVQDLVRIIRNHRPGDQVTIKYRRNNAERETEATLAGRRLSGARAARFKMMNRLGAVPSRRDGDFPSVFQHDTPLFPEQCGGPIVDLEGNVVGMNIARRGRAASFAMPAGLVQQLVDEMLKETIAKLPE